VKKINKKRENEKGKKSNNTPWAAVPSTDDLPLSLYDIQKEETQRKRRGSTGNIYPEVEKEDENSGFWDLGEDEAEKETKKPQPQRLLKKATQAEILRKPSPDEFPSLDKEYPALGAVVPKTKPAQQQRLQQRVPPQVQQRVQQGQEQQVVVQKSRKHNNEKLENRKQGSGVSREIS